MNLRESKSEKIDENCEEVKRKINALIRDGMKIKDVKVKSAVRKKSRNDKPGLVIASLETPKQKQKVMKEKGKLKNSSEYHRVYINNDLPKSEQNTQSSLRTILKELGKERQYTVNGSRITPRIHSTDGNGRGNRIDQARRGSTTRDLGKRRNFDRGCDDEQDITIKSNIDNRSSVRNNDRNKENKQSKQSRNRRGNRHYQD